MPAATVDHARKISHSRESGRVGGELGLVAVLHPQVVPRVQRVRVVAAHVSTECTSKPARSSWLMYQYSGVDVGRGCTAT